MNCRREGEIKKREDEQLKRNISSRRGGKIKIEEYE